MNVTTRVGIEDNLRAELADQRRLADLLRQQLAGLVSGEGAPEPDGGVLEVTLDRCRQRHTERELLCGAFSPGERLTDLANRLGPSGVTLRALVTELRTVSTEVQDLQQRVRLVAVRSQQFLNDLVQLLSGRPGQPQVYGPAGQLGGAHEPRTREA